jgi:hypothetical protein
VSLIFVLKWGSAALMVSSLLRASFSRLMILF